MPTVVAPSILEPESPAVAPTASVAPEPSALNVLPIGAPWQSLFWRIFLWFWLATLCLAGAVAATVFFTAPDEFFPRSRYVPLQLIDRLANRSVAVFEEGGPAALRTYLQNLPKGPEANGLPSHAHFQAAYLFAAAGTRELANQQLSADFAPLVARTVGSADLQLERHLGRMEMARSLGGGAGDARQYVFVLTMPRASVFLPTTPQVMLEIAAAFITSALVCYWLAHHFVSPLRQLQAAARQLAGGDLGVRVGNAGQLAARRDEFGVLARDFDHMAARIEDSLAAQRRLLADISHELGSPLTRLNVALGLAFRKSPGDAHPELERIQTEAGRLNELIRQLLLISELENRDQSDPAESFDLHAVVLEIAADAEFEASSRQCKVRVTSEATLPVRGVRHLLRSAVENVVRNAVHYTAERTEVSIETSAYDGCAVVRVRDHGPGVPPGALAHLFDPFYRVSEARDRLSGGTGLGLAITRQAVEAHRGSVHAENLPGDGLLVEIRLPV